MLATYQAKLIDNKIKWLDTPPKLDNADIIVTVLPKQVAKTLSDIQKKSIENQPKRQLPESLKGVGKTIGDIMDMSEMSSEWEFMND